MHCCYYEQGSENLKIWDINDLFFVNDIAINAGKAILEIYYNLELSVHFKKDKSPLTNADLASHEYITKALKKFTPDLPILSEEGILLDSDIKTFWCIDPLDGTKEFLKKNNEFTVNIALVVNNKPFMGVVHIPATNISFFGLKNKGAYVQKENSIKKLPKQKYSINSKPIFTVSRSHINDITKKFIEKHNAQTISAGSSLKLTMLAEGKADAYPRFGPTSLWDIAAGHAIINETGGKIITFDDQDIVYELENILNPSFIALRNDKLNYFISD